jgi:hypothetical protein
MESMNLLDITIRYFNVIVFVMCVVFGMISLFASWIAWREIHRKKNVIRSVLAAYNIAEDALEKGRTRGGGFDLDPVIVQTIFNSLQEVLNAVYGELTGKSVPAREDRSHGSGRLAKIAEFGRIWRNKEPERMDLNHATPVLVPEDREHHQSISHP